MKKKAKNASIFKKKIPKPRSKEEYSKYLRTFRWTIAKRRLYRERGRQCEKCPNTKALQVHHLTYDRVGNERYSDLQILCAWCHAEEHDRIIDEHLQAKIEKEAQKQEVAQAALSVKKGFVPKIVLRRKAK